MCKTCSASEKLYCETFFALHVRVTSLYMFMIHDVVFFSYYFRSGYPAGLKLQGSLVGSCGLSNESINRGLVSTT